MFLTFIISCTIRCLKLSCHMIRNGMWEWKDTSIAKYEIYVIWHTLISARIASFSFTRSTSLSTFPCCSSAMLLSSASTTVALIYEEESEGGKKDTLKNGSSKWTNCKESKHTLQLQAEGHLFPLLECQPQPLSFRHLVVVHYSKLSMLHGGHMNEINGRWAYNHPPPHNQYLYNNLAHTII